MTRRNRNQPLVPQAKDALKRFEGQVMSQKGYHVNQEDPRSVKYEVAEDLNIPLDRGYNGNLTSKQAGKVGGNIGGNMVKEMIRMAQENFKK